jgi:hypothetical protein
MRMRAPAALLVAFCVAGCAQAPAKEDAGEKPELSPQAKSLVLEQVPSDIPHPLYIDFNGRADLLGYALDPEGTAPPGSRVSLKLYWRSTGKLDAEYVPYTELVLPDGSRSEVEGTGPVRKGELVPSNWEQGKVYVDEVSFTVPKDIDAARFSIVVGLRTQPIAPEAPAEVAAPKDSKKAPKKADLAAEGAFGPVYLSVLSGPADGKYGGVVASIETGVTAASLRARAKNDKRAADAALKRPAGKPASAKPRPAPAQ